MMADDKYKLLPLSNAEWDDRMREREKRRRSATGRTHCSYASASRLMRSTRKRASPRLSLRKKPSANGLRLRKKRYEDVRLDPALGTLDEVEQEFLDIFFPEGFAGVEFSETDAR